MFTGLVEAMGELVSLSRKGGICEIRVLSSLAAELKLGQSVAVSGVCLTVTGLGDREFTAEMMPETAARTKFAALKPRFPVNLERALGLQDRLDGHIVQGHVDGTARTLSIEKGERNWVVVFGADKPLMKYIVPKGSVALDGVSLTVIDAGEDRFSVGLIPTTLKSCTIQSLQTGDQVNLETDILGRFVERLLQFGRFEGGERNQALTMERLAEMGYSASAKE
jgi:riboflavin synthase